MRARREHNARMEQAFVTATIPLMKKVPKLEKYLVPVDDRRSPGRQTADEAKAVMKQIFERRRRKPG